MYPMRRSFGSSSLLQGANGVEEDVPDRIASRSRAKWFYAGESDGQCIAFLRLEVAYGKQRDK
jgi:hypothetical protein